ncbi:MAG: YgfZ/GcvT domain-containing protein, partial [Planctomycetaceae bacterium]
VAKLEPGYGREAFVTEVRGKALGHVCIFRTEQGVRLIGAGSSDPEQAGNQAAVMAAHFDRYTIREKSVPQDVSSQFTGFVVERDLAGAFFDTPQPSTESTLDLASMPFEIADCRMGMAYQVPWWEGGAWLLLVGTDDVEAVKQRLIDARGTEAEMAEFHRRRILNRFPWYGVDIDASHLPQEADRDDLAISFTKGCYLGQETIARLDALGQVQKKLVRWKVTANVLPAAGTELRAGERVVGRLTSVAPAPTEGEFIALGFARRSHFDPGSQATGQSADGSPLVAVVGTT